MSDLEQGSARTPMVESSADTPMVGVGNTVDTRSETVCTTDMTSTNFSDATTVTYETVWGGPCDHHSCEGDCGAFFTVNFADGGSVGGYLCRNHINQYEAAYGLPLSVDRLAAAA